MHQRSPTFPSASKYRHSAAAAPCSTKCARQHLIAPVSVQKPSFAPLSPLYSSQLRRLRHLHQWHSQQSSCSSIHDDHHDVLEEQLQAETPLSEFQPLHGEQQQPSDVGSLAVPHLNTQPLQHASPSHGKLESDSILSSQSCLTPQTAPPPPAATAAAANGQSRLGIFEVPVAESAPSVTSERLKVPPGSISLQSAKQLLASAARVFTNPSAPVEGFDDDLLGSSAVTAQITAQAAVAAEAAGTAAGQERQEDTTAVAAAAEQNSVLMPSIPQNSLSLQTREQIIPGAASSLKQVRDVGLDAVVEAADSATSALCGTARSALLATAAAVLSASSAGAVSQRQLSKQLQMDDAAAEDLDSSSAAEAQYMYSSSSGSSRSGAGSADVLVTAKFDATTFIDAEDGMEVITATISSSTNRSRDRPSMRTPLANLEQSRAEVTKYLNQKREVAAQRLMKRTEIFANRLRDSAKETGAELGPVMIQTAIAFIGRRTVVDAIKVLGRRNAAAGMGAVGGENAAAATEQLGVGGFAEVTGLMGPKGLYKLVEELGPVQSMKMGRKLVIDNADKAVSKMKKNVVDGKGVRGVLQKVTLGCVWWASAVWFGLFALGKGIIQGFAAAVGALRAAPEVGGTATSSSSTPRPDLP